MSNIKHITDETFEQEITGSTPVLVDFWAPWCGPCRMMAPVLERLAGELGDSLKVVKVNVDEDAEHARQLGIRGIPTLILFKDGEPVDELVGFVPGPALRKWLQPHLAATTAAA